MRSPSSRCPPRPSRRPSWSASTAASTARSSPRSTRRGQERHGQGQAGQLRRGRRRQGLQARRPQDHRHRQEAGRGRASRARTPRPRRHGLARTGSRATASNNLAIKNMKVTNYVANGFFMPRHGEVRLPRLPDEEPGGRLQPLLRPLRVQLHRRPDDQRRSATARATRPATSARRHSQKKPKWTRSTTTTGYENVLGYSGTNSKYVNIHDSDFYNNGAGVVPNTLDSEPLSRTATGSSRTTTSSGTTSTTSCRPRRQDGLRRPRRGRRLDHQLPDRGRRHPLRRRRLGRQEQQHLRQLQVGRRLLLGPGRQRGRRRREQRTTSSSTTGWAATAPTTDQRGRLLEDGSGSRQLLRATARAPPSTRSAQRRERVPYPTCPAPAPPASGTGTSVGDAEQQFGDLSTTSARTTDPPRPQHMECDWTRHAHPAVQELQAADDHAGPGLPP